MEEPIIQVKGIAKKYVIRHENAPYKTFQDAIIKAVKAPFNLLKNNGRPPKKETFWALKDITFDVNRGEVVGIIGRNGAGKTTLLKILSRITEPTEGKITLRGRVASLLEVGTGFHPELTGRENIYLNGSVLGMTRKEIDSKFDEIVKFAEVEKFLDTPVKRYSSGMYVRLAFAVAAHLEPEILFVDEVLSVGDAEFQKKCLGKMGDVAKEGRTVLFVSHNMPAITRLCPRTIWINGGRILAEGSSEQVVSLYLKENTATNGHITLPPDPEKTMRLRRIAVLGKDGMPSGQVEMGEPFRIQVEYDVNRPVNSAHVICFIYTSDGVNVLGTGDADCLPEWLGRRESGTYCGEFQIPSFLLGEGWYSLTVSMGIPYVQAYERHEAILSFEVFDATSKRRQWQHKRRPGILGVELPWNIKKLS